jgi:hypothetical protein
MPHDAPSVEMPKGVQGGAIAIPKGGHLLTSTPYAYMNDTFLVAERDVTADELRNLIEQTVNEESFLSQAHTIGLVGVERHLLIWVSKRDGVRFHQP